MPQDGDQEPPPPGQGPGLHPLRRVLTDEPPATAPEVKLLREFKGLTVAELVQDLALSEQLPGLARSALHHVEQGDLAAAEQSLPGSFGSVLPGPGHRRPQATARFGRLLVAVLALAAAAFVLLV